MLTSKNLKLSTTQTIVTLFLVLLTTNDQRTLVTCSNDLSQIQGQNSQPTSTSTSTTTESPVSKYVSSSSTGHQVPGHSHSSYHRSVKESRHRSPSLSSSDYAKLITPRSDLMMSASSGQRPMMVQRSGFGIPNDFNSPHGHHHHHHRHLNNFYSQRDLSSAAAGTSGSPDYQTNGAGFIMSDLQSEASSNRLYDLALASSETERTKALLGSRVRSTSLSDRPMGPSSSEYSSIENSSGQSSSSHTDAEIASYLKAAASEAASSAGGSPGGHEHSSQLMSSSSGIVGRRKPIYADRVVEEQHIFDPAVTKHLLQKQRENEYAANALMESGLNSDPGAGSDSELAQQLAAMSELHSNHPNSASDYLPLSGSSFNLNPNSFSSLVEYSGHGSGSGSGSISGLRGFSSLGGLSSLSGQSLATSASSLPSMITPYALAAASGLPRAPSGVPAGAIVGAPGSAPPPGMKLAGYVTMTNPSPPMMNPQMSSSMVNPIALMSQNMPGGVNNAGNSNVMNGMAGAMTGNMASGMVNNPQAQAVAQMMAQGMGQNMGQGMKYPFGPMSFGPGVSGQNQALQALLGGAMGQVGQQAVQTAAASTTTGTATSAASPAAATASAGSTNQPRNRFFSRLNPLNLFRRFRINRPAQTTSTESSVSEAEKRSSVVKEYFSNSAHLQKYNQYHPRIQQYALYTMPHSRRARSAPTETPTSKSGTEPTVAESAIHSGSGHNDTETAENYYPFPGGYFVPASGRMRFPGRSERRRGSRRYSSSSGYLSSVENRGGSVGLMGSGNFEVIRGGILPGQAGLRSHSAIEKPHHQNEDKEDRDDSGYDDNDSDDDKSGAFSPLEDEFFSAGSPGILGFQGFNHFSSSSSVYNTLAPSRRKSNVLKEEKGSEALASERSQATDLQAIS